MKIINVVGARPNFMKMAPIIEAMRSYPDHFQHLLVHTGQHYDEKMSESFFVDLGMPTPDINLGVGSGSHAEQTARIMVEFEKICLREKPQLVIVVGDVNSTMACTITAKKLGIKVAHVEAGLRSRDMSMPEEINRLCTDVLCDYLFTTDHFADENLAAEGVPADKIFFVGNVMIDTLLKHRAMAATLDLGRQLGLAPQGYATLTMHRPGNVDDKNVLTGILEALAEIAREIPIVFPIHPRTRKMAGQFGLDGFFSTGPKVQGLWITAPLGYLEFLHLNMNARFVLTDSGGLQEETTVLGIPCITMRPNTERPITCEVGSNTLVGNSKEKILEQAHRILNGEIPRGLVPEKWDGHAAERIIQVLLEKPC
ncbi:UDP-N-acetylglucosamine 2-epimerase (non-hydrolyzing) [Desulfoprunum benzoelyticum]|uniref:UDP-N-acetylglucosamine 2-epimerase (Non-hydrolyzing) n=1 Tax=Desulfoprunum benzoelyticum TaxID=1506996 RepID=A0A840UW89_9BACT|nr:UDP-N-acetylglucosamine 2-epimerase (non-hydrolyzing) [Desulfoprunum benzoelyticum]MBB5346968.1 UDP-N-acetylglucosamine 2-epimerase (non-hydrolyzing) [Desulfoprunum benzoelyticum]MBM9531014.1 UDP-N-acetylglucosamine 2-epimerase (non-hydrolyzing) [Desulfoprunum benzoelyticum]